MRIAILTSGRYWLLDLARELDALGHDVAFYSLVPPWRTSQFGLPKRCNRWLAPVVAPFYLAAKAGAVLRDATEEETALTTVLDTVARRVIDQCDVFIGISGMCMRTIGAVRQRYGSRVFVERGSRHILSQREILEGLERPTGSPPQIPNWVVQRELTEYDLADTVVVPSKHVVESFLERGVDEKRIFRNPYGVDLQMFPATEAPDLMLPRILTVGTWSLRKGCDVLAEAWRRLAGTTLCHVGPVGDARLPSEPNFEHHDAVDQARLTIFYSSAHVLALASREDGLALVQAQALASGLPVVCTDRTGGEDLRELLDDPSFVSVVPWGDAVRLATSLEQALELAQSLTGVRDLLGGARARLSWRAYGERYNRALRERV